MSKRSTTHATFAIERTYHAPPARVFHAWADPAAKARWFGPSAMETGHTLEFEVGGRERLHIEAPDGSTYTFGAVYQDIVEDLRIIYSYEMLHNGLRISVSLATVELQEHDGGTLLRFTEQGAFLDGHDTPSVREEGTRSLLEALAAELHGGKLEG